MILNTIFDLDIASALFQWMGSGLSFYNLSAGHAHKALTLTERLIESNVFNVALVLLILGFLLRKFNVAGQLDNQRKQIAADVEAAECQKREALEQLNALKDKVASLDQSVQEILEEARQTGESISRQMIETAEQESLKIIENTRKRLEMEAHSASRQIQAKLLREAVADARLELVSSYDTDEQSASVDQFLAELPLLERRSR
jgi:F-type H+-transporting ATPase subunit b